MALPTLQGAVKDGFGEAVVVCDMLKACKFPSLDSCQKRFLWTHKGVDLAPHLVIGLVPQVGNMEKFPHALGQRGQGLNSLRLIYSLEKLWCGKTVS